MRTGKMRYRVILQKPTSENVRRGQKQTFEDVDTVWCSIRQKRVAEQNNKKQVTVIGQYEIRIWRCEGLDESWRIKHGDQVYNIIQADDSNNLIKETIIIAKRNKLKE